MEVIIGELVVKAYMPLPLFPAISITGEWCGLKCKYCGGKLLKGMLIVNTPHELYSLCRRLKENGVIGCLISGGFSRDGVLPIKPFIQTIRDIKKDLEFIISIHVGFASRDYAEILRNCGVDIVDLNVINSIRVFRDIMGLSVDLKIMEETIKNLIDYGPPYIAPHIMIGADYGKVYWETEAIDLLKDIDLDTLIFVVFSPIHGTEMEHTSSPNIIDVVKVFQQAKSKLPNIEIGLGCARPRGSYSVKLEKQLIQNRLIDRVVIPSRASEYLMSCCSIPKELEYRIPRRSSVDI
ncbi:MAG: radical SAM protein [Candidatus Methanomethylicia archaeon]